MNRFFANLTARKTAGITLLACAASLLAGCGMGITAAPDTSIAPSFSGKAMGGQSPIIGATVKIYATTSATSSYGIATKLQEANAIATGTPGSNSADTDSSGYFNFAGGYNCPAGQFVYITITGGNTGANAVNSNLALVAALGRCEDLYNLVGSNYTGYKGTTPVVVNELTTIAAAYALGHFSAVSGSGAAEVIQIGSSSTNNAAQIGGTSTGCVVGGLTTPCTTTAAAGLAHAFQNAANLASVTGGGVPATLPGNSAALVPQQLINSLGNTLVACVNSAGGTAGDGTTSCGSIFGATTIGSNVPTDTFSAMVNLAANPTLGGSPSAVASFIGYATAQTTIYTPALSATTNLNDLSIGIEYPKGMSSTACTLGALVGQCQALAFPQTGALDINDNYYAGNDSATGAAPTNILSLSSAGTLLGVTLNNTTLKNSLGLALDSAGNGFFGNGTGSTGSDGGKFSFTSGGVVATAPTTLAIATGQNFAFAVDRANNVWVSSLTGIWMAPAATNTTFTIQGTGTDTYAAPSSRVVGFAVDPDQNIWASPNTSLYILPNSGTAAVPSYTTSGTPNTILASTTIANTASAIVFVSGSPYAAYIPGYSTGTNPGVQAFVPTVSTATVTGPGAGSLFTSTAITGSLGGAADGAGNIWLADSIGKSVTLYNPTAATAYRYEPCVVTGSTSTTCTNFFGSAAKMFNISVDSAGSVWLPDAGDGNLVEIIGAAAPTWPLLSLGLTGKP